MEMLDTADGALLDRQLSQETERVSKGLLLSKTGRAGQDSSITSEAWQAATAFIDADVSLGIAGTADRGAEPSIYGQGLRRHGLARSQIIILLTALRKSGFRTAAGDEVVTFGRRGLEAFAQGGGLDWLLEFSGLAACRIDGKRGDRYVGVYLRREPREMPFYDRDVQQTTVILRHCAFAQRHTAQIQNQKKLGWRAFWSLSQPVLVVGPDLKLLYANRQADRYLKSADVLQADKEGCLTTSRSNTTQLLKEAVASGLDRVCDHVCSIALNDDARLILVIRTLPREPGFPGGAVIALQTEEAAPLPRQAFFEAAGLLRSEAKFLTAMARTGALSDAAEELGLSEETGRTYVKRVLGKLGLRNQFELGKFVSSRSAPFADFGSSQ